MAERFPDGTYADVPGFCRVATDRGDRGAGLEPQPRPLRRCRPLGEDDGDFERLAELHEEFTMLSDEAEALRRKVDASESRNSRERERVAEHPTRRRH